MDTMQRPTPAWTLHRGLLRDLSAVLLRFQRERHKRSASITAKLDYIADLGCTASWLNPCFASPFGDAGYDVADFYQVAPRYGTDGDLLTLFREARKRGIRVCLDFVAGHTSVEHPWFKESCRSEQNRYSNWHI